MIFTGGSKFEDMVGFEYVTESVSGFTISPVLTQLNLVLYGKRFAMKMANQFE